MLQIRPRSKMNLIKIENGTYGAGAPPKKSALLWWLVRLTAFKPESQIPHLSSWPVENPRKWSYQYSSSRFQNEVLNNYVHKPTDEKQSPSLPAPQRIHFDRNSGSRHHYCGSCRHNFLYELANDRSR